MHSCDIGNADLAYHFSINFNFSNQFQPLREGNSSRFKLCNPIPEQVSENASEITTLWPHDVVIVADEHPKSRDLFDKQPSGIAFTYRGGISEIDTIRRHFGGPKKRHGFFEFHLITSQTTQFAMQATNDTQTNEKMPLEVARAYGYHLKGLTAHEIGKLLDVSARTVQRWATAYEFQAKANPRPLQERAAEMFAAGHSYREIGKAIKKGKTTIYNYLKASRAAAHTSPPTE